MKVNNYNQKFDVDINDSIDQKSTIVQQFECGIAENQDDQ